MKNNLFGEKVCYENFEPPFVLIALMSRFVNRYQSVANAFFKELSWQQMFFLNGVTLFKETPSIKAFEFLRVPCRCKIWPKVRLKLQISRL
mgnify:CR=1 FL=1